VLTWFARSAKTGIGNRSLKPTLGIIDPINMETMPKQVAIASGFDVLCHSLESYTAIPYDQRTPRPLNPNLRPAYQGSNPISDVWCQQSLKVRSQQCCKPEDSQRVRHSATQRKPPSNQYYYSSLSTYLHALPQMLADNFLGAVDTDDITAKEQMCLAATYAGVGFGNAGVHLCHGMSYPISGLNKGGPRWVRTVLLYCGLLLDLPCPSSADTSDCVRG
jgi:hydroxyacid-oxoacid transhydrogenase